MNTAKHRVNGFVARMAGNLGLLLGLLAGPTGAAIPLGGSGTEANPYLITSLADLVTFRNWVNATNDCAGEFYQLTADIDMTGVHWTPIGDGSGYVDGFAGTFDGGGHMIANLVIEADASYYALFGLVSGTLENLTIADSHVSGAKSGYALFSVRATGDFTMRNCHAVNSSVSAYGSSGLMVCYVSQAGAVAFENCGTDGDSYATLEFGYQIAGLVGQVSYTDSVTFSGCTNRAAISGAGSIGGIVGQLGSATKTAVFTGCANMGKITVVLGGSPVRYAGGLVGYKNMGGGVTGLSMTFTDCHNSGAVVGGEAGAQLGGFVGYSNGTEASLTRCVNSGAIGCATYLAARAAGFIAIDNSTTDAIRFEDCANTGALIGTSVGAFGATMPATITLVGTATVNNALTTLFTGKSNGTYADAYIAGPATTVYFAEFADAVAAAGSGDTVTLLGDDLAAELAAGQSVTIDDNGHSGLSITTVEGYQVFQIAGTYSSFPNVPTAVWVDDDFTEESCGGHVWGYNAFTNIQDGVDAMVAGGTVNIAGGTYAENVYVDKDLIIVGAGAAATIVDGGASESVFFVDGDIDVTIEGLTIQNGSAAAGGGVYVQAGGLMDSDLAVYDCVFKNNVATSGNGGALANLGLYEAVVLEGCTFAGNTASGGNGGAVSIIDGALAMVNCTVSGNTARNGGGCAFNFGTTLDLAHITVTLNSATGSAASKGGGLSLGGAGGTIVHTIVCGNTDQFSGTTTDNINGTIPGGSNNLIDQDAKLVALADNGGPTPTHALLADSPALNAGVAGTVTYDQRGVPRNQGNAPDVGAFEMPYHTYADDSYTAEACGGHVWGADAFATIQAAVNAVGTAGTVDVAAGTYAENLDLAKPVALLGLNADISPNTGIRVAEAVIDPPGTGNNWVGRAIKIATDDVTIKGFKVTGVDSDAAIVSGYGSYGINTDNVRIEKILFADITASAIYTMSASGQCSNWTVTDNRIQNVANGATPNSGMNLWDQSNLICTYNEILNVGYAGIQLGGGVGVTIATVQYNKITNVAQQGIQIANACSDILVADNLINGANLIQAPDKGGIRLDGTDYTGAVTIRNNTISNSFNGIAVKDGQNIDGKQITVIANNIANNTQAGIYNGGTGTLAASSNWWGSASGPTSPDNPGGTGTAVSGLVDFLPFYTEVALDNLAPYGLVLSPATVAENAAIGTTVGTLGSTDDDDTVFAYTLVAGAGDTDNDSFTLDVDTLKTAASFDFEAKSSYSVRIQTSDGHGGLFAKALTVSITDIEETPVLDPVGDQTAYEDIPFTFTATAFDSDKDELTFTWTGVPAGATATAAGVFSWTPTQADVGAYPMTVTVSDGSLTDSENFTLTVEAVNDNPTVANALPDLNRQQDFATFTIPLAPVFADAENDTLAYSVAADGVVGASVDGSTLTLSSIAGNRGTATVTVTATETATPEKLAVSDTFTVTVKPVLNTTQNTFFDTIQAAVADAGTLAGDVISVAAGTYEPPVCITVAKNLVLQGPPCEPSSGLPEVTISGNGAHRIFEVSAGCTLNLKNLAIANGSGSYGGAISASGSLRAEACLFIDNVSSGYGSAIAAQCGQGCVLFLTNCTFAANTQTGSGGGGAVYVTNGKDNGSAETGAEIYDCVFVSNTTATCSASALMVNASNAKVADCTFQYNSSMSAVFADNGGDIEFSGCRFDHNAGANGTVYFASENTCTFTACDFTLNTVSGASINGGGAIYCSGVAKIVGCAFVSNRVESAAGKGGGALVFGSGSSCSVVTGCVFVANGLAGSGSGTSIFVSKGSAAATLVTLSANYWNDGGFPTISSTDGSADIYYQMAGGGSSAVVESFYADLELTDLRYCVVYVDDDFTEATEGWGLNRFKTVQGGVDAVAAGGTVHVAAGTYAGATLTKSVNLLGSNAGIAGYGIRADESVISSVVNMTGNGTSVLIDGFKFAVTPYLMFGKNDAASKQTADWIFQNNLVEASGAIYSEVGQVNLNWRDVVVTRNRFVNMTSNAVITHNVRSLTATDNKFDTLNGSGNALSCQNIGTLTVAGNSFSNIGWNAVQLVGATSVTITNNVCGNLGAEAFKLGGPIVNGVCSYNTIVGANTANEVDVGGIRIRVAAGQPYNVEIIGNYIENSYNGLAVRNGDDLDGTSITVAQNTFVDNSHAGVYNGSDDTLTVSENYWGTAFGPSGAGFFGTGDAIIGPVAIENYYTDAALTTLHYFDLYVDDNGIEDATHFLTIEAAYAAANPGDTIHVADGSYTLGSTFTVAKRGLTITGTSSAAVSIDASARTGTAYGVHVAASDVTLEHFTLIPASYAGAGFPIHVSGTPGILSNITLRDIVIADSYRTPFDFNGVDNLVLDGLVATGADYGSGIGLSGCVGVTITGCQTADNAWGGVRVSGSTDVEPDRASSDIDIDFTANTFAEVNALYVEDTASSVDATGYSYKLTTSAGITTYLEEGYTEPMAIAVALAAEATFPGLTVTGLFEADGDAVPFDGDVSTADVYVDDDWAGTPSGYGIQKPGAPAGTYLQFGRNAFDTVQGGVKGVDEGGTVHIANGLYLDSNTTLDKAMTLVGQSRDGVVIAPEAEDENLTTGGFTGVYQHGFVIATSDVTVTNLTIDGKANPALTEGKCNFRAGVIANSDVHSNVILADLTIRSTWLYGIYVRTATARQGGAGNAILNCWIEDMGFNAYPSYAIFSSYSGEIAGNVITNAGYRGMCLYNANVDVYDNTIWSRDYDPVEGSEGICIYGDTTGNLAPAPVAHVYRNTIHLHNASVKGAGINVLYGTSSTVIGGDTLDDGNVIYLNGGAAADHGIECWWTKTGQPLIQNNTIYADDEDSAVWMFANRSKTAPVEGAAPIFKGNRFYASNSDGTVPGRGTGVFITEDMRFFGDGMDAACYAILKGNLIDGFARGIDLYRSGDGPEDYDEREHTVQAVIGGANPADANTIQNCGVGVRLFVHPDAYDGPLAKVCDATILGNTTTFAGNDIAILIDGGTASVTQNRLYDNGIAIQAINGGSLTALDGNTFEGGATHDDNGTDLLISATAGAVAIGTGNAFAGDLNFIDNRSAQDFDLTSNSTTFDVADPYDIEDLIYHKVDEAACGLVRYVANEIFVTQSSGSIQRGVDAATAGDTVNVAAGTYSEQLTIAKALMVTGHDGAVLNGTGLGTTAVGVCIKSGNVTFDNVDVVSFEGNGIICGYEASIPGGLPNISIVNCRIADIQPGSSHGFGIYVGYESEGFGYVPPDLTAHLDYSGLVIRSNEIVNTMCSGLVLQSITAASGSLLVADNYIHGIMANSGIWLDCARNVTVENNVVSTNKWGIELTAYAEFGTLEGPYGPKDILIRNNVVTDNAQQGIGLYEGWPQTVTVTANNLAGNGIGLQNDLAKVLAAENNWWGDATGPANAVNPGGLGVAVVGNVDFSPWLGTGAEDPVTGGAIGFQPLLEPLYYLPLGLKFTIHPQNAALGGSLGTVTVQVTNELGAVATQFTGDVTLAIGSQPGAGVLTGTLTKACVAGEVSFSDLAVTIDGGSGLTLAASVASPITGATSAAFDIANPLPVLGSMSPIFAAAGSGDLTLTLSGSAFVKSSVVKWGAAETVLVPAAVAADSITVTVPAALLATAGTAAVKVFSPAAGGGTSTELAFTITATALAPEVWVDDDWTGYADCGGHTWGYDAFRTIQDALNGVADGGMIHVNAGTYTETASAASKQFDLIGEMAPDGSPLPLIVGRIAIDHPGNDTGWRIENLRFRAGTESSLLSLKNVNRAAVANCVFDGAGRFADAPVVNGLAFETCPNGNTFPTVTGCVFSNGLYSALTGIASDLTVSDCLINNVKSGMNMRGSRLSVLDSEIAVKAVTTTDTYGIRYGTSDAGTANDLNVSGCVITVDQNGFEPAAGEYHCAVYIRSGATGVHQVSNCSLGGDIVNLATLPVTLDASGNWWGSADAAAVKAKILAGSVDYSPWLAVGTDTDGGALGFKGDFSSLYVDDDSPQAGTVGRVQEGVNLGTAGGTVNVLAGTYAEAVQISKSVNLIGDSGELTVAGVGPAAPILDGATLAPANGFDILPGVDNVAIRGFVIQNFQSTSPGTGVGIRSANTTTDPSTNIVIRDNQLNTNVWAGVMAWNGGENGNANWDISYNVVRMGAWSPDNNVYGIELDNAIDSVISHNIVSGGWDGIVVQAVASGASSITARNILVEGNNVSGCQDLPMWLLAWKQGSGAVTLTDVTVTGNTVANGGKAFLANQYDGATLSDLVIEDNAFSVTNPSGAGHAVDLADVSGDSSFSRNSVIVSGSIGGGGTFFHAVNVVGASTGTWLFEENELDGNGVGANSAGIRIRSSLPATSVLNIASNVITEFANGINSDTLASGVDVNVNLNNLAGNSINGLLNGSSATINAESNWWGNATGPAHWTNPGGTGVSVSDNVDFSPWLGEGTDTEPDAIGFQPNLTPLYYLPVGIHFSTEPTGALLGAALGTQPAVTVTNEIGGVATQFNGSIALAIGVNPGVPVAGEMTGTAAVTVTNSVAIFDGLSIVKGTGNGYTLVATTLGLPAVTSAAFNILNSTPVLTDVADWTTGEQSAPSAFLAQATDTAADLVAQTLTFSLVCTSEGSMPEGITFDTATGAFSWQTVESQGGRSYTFELTVTDDGTGPLSASDTFTVTVNEVNVAPVIDIEDTSLEVDEEPAQALTFTATATDQDRVPFQALTFSLAAVAGQTYPAGAAIVTTDAGDGTASGAFSWTPTEAQGGSNYVVDVVVTDNGANPMSLAATQRVTIAVAEVNVAPVLDTIPPQSAVFGQTLTFTATATDHDLPAQTLTYSLDGEPDGAVIDPASGVFTWTPTEAQAQGNFSFTVTVTDDGLNEDALSDSQTVTIGAIAAEQFCPGFRSPSTSMVVSNSLTFGGTLTDLTWTPVLPAGWTVLAASAVGGNGVAATNGLGGVVFTTLPATSPVDFTYTVGVPGNTAVSNAVGAVVSFNGLTAAVAPITVYRYHSADYRADISGEFVGQFRKIDSTEINRVLAYWRYGYKPDAAGYDGFVAMPGYTGEGGRHSADYQTPYWVIDTDEASLVQEYWRAGGYHADATTVDGYAYDRAGPGPSPLGGFSILALPLSIPLPPVVSMAAPESYDPGQSVTVTSTFLNNSTEKLLRFIWRLDVPEGWRITGVSGDGLPELDTTGTNVLLLAGTLPTSQISLTLTLSVPLNETRAASVGCAASYKFYGMTDLATVTTSTTPMAPLDADADGLADAWAAAYGIDDPDGDPDGDRMTNLDEYLCGTIPTDETSYLRMVSVKPFPGRGVEISWSSEAGRVYTLQRAVGAPVGLVDFAADLPADPSGRNTYLDDTGLAAPCFYRVKLQQ